VARLQTLAPGIEIVGLELLLPPRAPAQPHTTANPQNHKMSWPHALRRDQQCVRIPRLCSGRGQVKEARAYALPCSRSIFQVRSVGAQCPQVLNAPFPVWEAQGVPCAQCGMPGVPCAQCGTPEVCPLLSVGGPGCAVCPVWYARVCPVPSVVYQGCPVPEAVCSRGL